MSRISPICEIGKRFVVSQYRLVSLLLLFIGFGFSGYSQTADEIWHFGVGNGLRLDFNTDPPSFDCASVIKTEEGSATLGGTVGFYTDGNDVWDESNNLYTNSGVLGGASSSSMSALVLTDPGNSDRYYIFTTPAFGAGRPAYSIVDITTETVVSKNNMLVGTTGSSEKVTATQKPDGSGYWIVVARGLSGNVLRVYSLDDMGVTFNSEYTLTSGTQIAQQGYMKFAPDGEGLMCSSTALGGFLSLTFNKTSGTITSDQANTVGGFNLVYGFEWSPDGNTLYVSTLGNFDNIGQLKKINYSNYPTPTTLTPVHVTNATHQSGALMLGVNGKIYWAVKSGGFGGDCLAAIETPDNYASPSVDLCDVSYGCSGVNQGVYLGLPYSVPLISSSCDPPTGQIDPYGLEYCTGSGGTLTLRVQDTSLLDTVRWYDANTKFGAYSSITVGITDDTVYASSYTSPTAYDTMWVFAELIGCDTTYSDTIRVVIHPDPTIGITDADTICPGADVLVTLSTYGGDTLRWQYSYNGTSWFNIDSATSTDIWFESITQQTYIRVISNYKGNSVSSSKFGLINTIMGTGGAGYTGDSSDALSATANFIKDVEVDASGNVYFCDEFNHAVRRIDAVTGEITTIAGTGAAGAIAVGDSGLADTAHLNRPYGLAIDAQGNVFIADGLNYSIRKIDAVSGVITTVAGNGSIGVPATGGLATATGFGDIGDVEVDASGNIYIADDGTDVIYRVDAITGILARYAGTTPGAMDAGDGLLATNAAVKFRDPRGLEIDPITGDLYFGSYTNHTIRKVDGTTGIITTVVGDGTTTADDNVLATATGAQRITDVIIDAQGNLYYSDFDNFLIRKVDADSGYVTTIAGTGASGPYNDDIEALSTNLWNAYGLALTPSGDIYAGIYQGNRVRELVGLSYALSICGNDTSIVDTIFVGGLPVAGDVSTDVSSYCSGGDSLLTLTGSSISSSSDSVTWYDASFENGPYTQITDDVTDDTLYTANYINSTSVSDTMWVYAATFGTCDTAYSDTVLVIIHPQPVLTKLPDADSCDQYTIPLIAGTLTGNEGYYSGTNGSGATYNVGDVLVADATIFVYDSTTTNPSCSVEDTFVVDIHTTPILTKLPDADSCDQYTIPLIAGTLTGNEGYYSGTNGSGATYNVGDVLVADATIFVYDSTTTDPSCSVEDTFVVDIHTTPILTKLPDADSCDQYTIPLIAGTLSGNEGYYSGTNGSGSTYAVGQVINADATIFVYDSTTTNPSCSVEDTFVVDIHDTPILTKLSDADSCDQYTISAITGTLTGNEGYYSGTNGSGSTYAVGQVINVDATIFVYDSTTTNPSCSVEDTFVVDIHDTPVLTKLPDADSCDQYTIPAINGTLSGNEGYYSGTNGSGSTYAVDQVINADATIFVYDSTTTNPSCSVEDTFVVDIHDTPILTKLPDADSCDQYTIPAITGTLTGNEGYYSGTNGSGSTYAVGQVLIADATIFVYDSTSTDPGCSIQDTFVVDIHDTPVLTKLPDADSCDQYTIPAITGTLTGNEGYYSGTNGSGSTYAVGQVINADATIFVYDSTTSNPSCSVEDTFVVDIHDTPVLTKLPDADSCDQYTIPAITGTLSGNEGYYSGTNGSGSTYAVGQVINADATIFVYDSTTTNPSCSVEDTFVVDIHDTPVLTKLPDADSCDQYTIPAITGTLTGNEGYYSGTNGSGSTYAVGQVINADATIFVYDSTATNPSCSVEDTFVVDIHDTPVLTKLSDADSCDQYTIPAITGTLTGNEGYYSGTNGSGSTYAVGQVINTDATIFVYDSTTTNPSCSVQDTFVVDIHDTPILTKLPDADSCDQYTIPAITGTLSGNEGYYSGTNGSGSTYAVGQVLIADATIFVYDSTTTNPSCSVEDTFTIRIIPNVTAGDVSQDLDTICTTGSTDYTLEGSSITSGYGHTVSWWEATAEGGAYTQIAGGNITDDTVFTASYTNATTVNDTIWIYSQTEGACDTMSSDTVMLVVQPAPIGGTLSGSDICPGDSVWLVLSAHVGDSIRWEVTNEGGGVWTTINTGTVDSIRVSPSADSTYRAIVSFIGSYCDEDTSTEVTINLQAAVNKGLWADADNTLEYCTGDQATDSLNNGLGGVLWQESTDGGASWVNYTGTATNDSTETFTYTNATNQIDTTLIRVRYTTTCDTVFSDTLAVIVHPQPVSGILAPDTTVCPGSAIDIRLSSMQGDSIFWKSHNGATWTQIAATDFASNDTTLSVTINSDTTFRVVVRYANGICLDSVSDSITVSMDTAAVSGDIAPNTVTYCTGDNAVLELTGSNATFTENTVEWFEGTTRSGAYAQIGAGITDEDTVFTATYTNVTTEPDTMWVYSMTVAACDTAYSDTVEVIIHPEPVGGTLSGSDICPGDSVWIVLTGHQGDSIRWEVKEEGANSWSLIAGATIDSIKVSPSADSTYRVIIKYANGTCAEDTSTEQTINLNAGFLVRGLWDDADNIIEYCTGDSVTDSLSGASQLTTLWQESLDGGSTWVNYSGTETNDSTETFTYTNAGTEIDTVLVRVRYASTCDTLFSDTLSLLIHPQPDGGNILNAGAICPGDSIQLVLDNYAGDSLVWESSANLSVWTAFFSGNDSVYVDPLDTSYYRVIVRYANGECLRDTSDTVRVEIQDVIINAVLNAIDTSYCTGDSIEIQANGASGTLTWQQYDGANWVAFTDGAISNDTVATVSITNVGTVIDTNYYRVKVSSTCDSAFSDSIVVIVHPQPDGGNILNSGAICPGDSIELVLDNYAGDSLVWESSTNLSAWAPFFSGNDSVYIDPLDTTYYRVVVRYALGECLRDTSTTVRVDIQDVIANGVITPAVSEYCTGDSVELTVGGTSGTVEWLQYNTGAWETLTQGNVVDDTVAHINLTNTSLLPDTNYYRVKISSTCDSAFSDSVMVIVHPAPTGGVLNSDNVCPGGEMTFYLTGYEGDSIRWESSAAGVNAWSSFTSNGVDTISFIPSVDTDVRAIVFYKGGTCSEDTSAIGTAIIFNGANAGVISGVDTLCMGDTSYLILSGFTGTIQWQDSIVGGTWGDVSGETDDSLMLYFPTDVDPDKYYRAIVASGACLDTSLIQNVFVKVCCVQPAFAITDPSDPFCGDSTTISVQTDALAGFFTYEWFLASDTVNAFATGIDLDTITVGVTDTFFVKITQSDLATCFIRSDSVQTDIRDVATVGTTLIDPSIMCVGDTAMLTVDGITGSIQWQENMGNIGTWVDLGSADNNDTIFVSPLEAESPIDYRVVVNNDVICYDTSNIVSLIVEERVMAGIISPITDTICDSDSIDLFLTGSVGMIQWQVLSGTNWVDLVDDTLTTVTVNPSVVNSPATYRAVLTNNVCDDTSGLSEITVYPLVDLNVTIAGPSSVCELAGAEFEITDSTGGGSDPVFEWYLDGVLHTSDAANMIYDASVTGNHDIMVIMTSDSLCARPDTTFDTTGLYVDPLLIPHVEMPFGDNRRCEDSMVTFTALVIEPAVSGNLITWFVNDDVEQSGIDELSFETDDLNHGDEVRVSIEVDPLGGCYTKFYDTTGSQIILIDKAPQVGDLQIDQEVCFGEGGTVILDNHYGDITWSWSEDGLAWTELVQFANDSLFVFIPSQVGTHPMDSIYTLFIAAEVSNTGECLPVNSDTASLTEYPEIDAEILVDQDCDLFELNVYTEVYDLYSFHTVWHQSDEGVNWVNNYSIEPSIYKERMDIIDEYFIAEFSNNVCTLQDTVEIIKCPDPDVDVANAMTPSDLNGQNDVFWIENIEFYPNNKLWIYNRWGNLIYKTEGYDNVDNAWGGTRLGVDMPAAVYYYILDLGTDAEHKKGTITIVR